jgi:hypothetical protein
MYAEVQLEHGTTLKQVRDLARAMGLELLLLNASTDASLKLPLRAWPSFRSVR